MTDNSSLIEKKLREAAAIGAILPDDNWLATLFSLCNLDQPFLNTLYQRARSQDAEGPWRAFACVEANHTKRNPDLPKPKLLQDDPLELIKNSDVQLPPFPAVLSELEQMVRKEDSNVADVARLVSSDAALSSFLLRLVNSAFYSFPAKIDTVSRGIVIVGLQPFYLLSTGLLFKDMLAVLPKGTLCSTCFWYHSVATALACREIWRKLKQPDLERMFTVGLLHDIGKLALACMLPEAKNYYSYIASYACKQPFHVLEDNLLAFDHAKFGGFLLRKWNMPVSLIMPILWHHKPQAAKQYQKEAAALHLANIIAKTLGYSAIPDEVLPLFQNEACEIIKLNDKDLLEICNTVQTEVHETSSVFLHGA